MPDPTHDLLAELGWLRTLARRLARDPELADDLVQDAWAVALAQTEPPRSWRAWLATVLPNLLHGHRRRNAARQRRELASRPPAGEGDSAHLLQRAEAQQKLAAAVLTLAEPYRATVLLRFFEGLPPRLIAARLGVPVATVHSRLQRALAQLRHQLDHDFAGRPQWLAAFAPIAWPVLTPTTLGLFVMNTQLKVLAAVAALACSAPLWWPASSGGDEPTPAKEPVATGRASGDGGSASRPGGAVSPASQRLDATPAPAVGERPAGATFAAAGRVCDSRGLPAADVPIGIEGSGTVAARSDAQGHFTCTLGRDHAELAAVGDRHVTVCSATWSAQATIVPVVVVADALALAGRVVDEHGAPVAGSEVLLQLPDDFDTRFPLPLDRTGRARWVARTGRDGAFALPRLPRLDGAALLVTADAFAPTTLPQPTADDQNLQVVLRRFHFATGELRGQVVDAGGAPAGGARVALGVTSVVSESDGSFALSLLRAGWPTALVAAKAGHGPARLEIPRSGGTAAGDWPSPLVLRLGPAPQSVRGRVMDQNGRGLANAEVWIGDPTPLGIAGLLPLQLEYLIAGGAVPAAAARMPVPFADDPQQDGQFMDQASVVRQPTACWFYVTTDANGAYELPGLLDRGYTLRAFDTTSGLFGTASDVFGGTVRDLTITRDEVWPELRGKVVSARGQPLAGVRLQHTLVAFQHEARVPGGRFEGTALREGAATTTGADGTFVLRDIGKRHGVLALSGDAVLPTSIDVGTIGEPLQCVFVAQARCQVEVVLQDPGEADEVAALDDHGKPVDLAVLRRNSNAFMTDLPLHDGRSGLFVVPERAAKLLLRRSGAVVRTIPFTPDPARTTTLQ